MDSLAPTPPPGSSTPTTPETPAPAVVAAATPGIARRLAPIALVAVLGGGDAWLFQRDVVRSRQLDSAEKDNVVAHGEIEQAQHEVEAASGRLRAERDKLSHAEEERVRLEGELEAAKTSGKGDTARLETEKAALARKVADLADKLGESESARNAAESARATAEARARELDQVMEALKKKRVNARRLAGLESPPRISAEVVSQDEQRTPPLLVLRVRDSLAGLEEGDVFYLVRKSEDGQEREAGRFVLERVDSERRLLQARIRSLEAGEKVSIGDKVTTVPPGK